MSKKEFRNAWNALPLHTLYKHRGGDDGGDVGVGQCNRCLLGSPLTSSLLLYAREEMKIINLFFQLFAYLLSPRGGLLLELRFSSSPPPPKKKHFGTCTMSLTLNSPSSLSQLTLPLCQADVPFSYDGSRLSSHSQKVSTRSERMK